MFHTQLKWDFEVKFHILMSWNMGAILLGIKSPLVHSVDEICAK